MMFGRVSRCGNTCGRVRGVVHPQPARQNGPALKDIQAPAWAPAFTNSESCSLSRSLRSVAASAWGADVVFTEGTIITSKKEAKDMKLITVDVGEGISDGYSRGGQFLQMKVGDSKPAFLAIANAPTASEKGLMEFLIKDVPDTTANLLVNLDVGDKVSVSPVMGKGFPIEKVPPEQFKHMLIFATGSGISPIKALIDSGDLNPTDRESVTLFYGATDTDSMSFLSRIPQWELMGVDVVPVYSARKEGYVQDIYKNWDKPGEATSTCALLCGQKDMAEAIYDIMDEQGISRDVCLTNF